MEEAASEDELEVFEVEVLDEPVYEAQLAAPEATAVPAGRAFPAPRQTAPRRAQPGGASGPSGSGLMAIIAASSVALVLVGAFAFWMLRKRGDETVPAGADSAAAQGASAGTPGASTGPPPSGQPITLWNARCSGANGAQATFGVEVRLDGLKPESNTIYHWIVFGPAGQFEFDINGAGLLASPRLSGSPPAGAPVQGPLTTYIEVDEAGARRRISNSAPVEIE